MSKYYKEEDLQRALIGFIRETGIDEKPYDYAVNVLDKLPTIEVGEDAISRATALEIYSDLYWMDERLLNFKDELDKVYEKLRNASSVISKPKEVIYGNEHNCIMTLFGECSYSETGCGDCAVVEKVRDALAKTQIETQNSNENSSEDAISRADAIKAYNDAIEELVEAEMEEFNLGDFTECSFNTTQLKLIARKIWDAPSVIPQVPNEDAVSRKGLSDKVGRYYEERGDFGSLECFWILQAIKNEPSVMPKPKEGEWVEDEYGIPHCSECNCINNTVYRNYCPNCGTRMKGAE